MMGNLPIIYEIPLAPPRHRRPWTECWKLLLQIYILQASLSNLKCWTSLGSRSRSFEMLSVGIGGGSPATGWMTFTWNPEKPAGDIPPGVPIHVIQRGIAISNSSVCSLEGDFLTIRRLTVIQAVTIIILLLAQSGTHHKLLAWQFPECTPSIYLACNVCANTCLIGHGSGHF